MEIESNPVTAPVTAHGKFLSRANTKFFLKAIRLERQTTPLDLYKQVNLRDRLKKFHDSHTTSLIVAYDDAGTVLDVAAQAGLCTIVELSVAPDALLARKSLRAERERLAEQVRALSARPGLIGYLIECHLSQDFLRVHGFERVRRRLRALITTVRRSSLNLLVAIKHRPSTRAAALLEEDFVYSVVPPLSPVELKEYVTGLHNLAESRPVVIEFEQAMPDQDDLVASAFGLGAAGVVAPVARAIPRPDLMTLKMLTAAEVMPFLTLNGSCPPRHVTTPMVSVVICAYNAERTMRPCLESLRKLDYPNYEVVIVDDGSRDRTAEISMDFPEFRLIRQPNKGLSVARNVGMQAARGDLIAYTDSDCVVDPHWLTFMVRAMVESGFDGCGGPNYAPHEEGRVEGCVAASPGAPCHVLTGEDRAEHLAGCNMVFSKSALLAVGGFDPQFNAAGDDVDICWRMLESAFRLGFCPSAFVWHFRRNTVKAYYGQQRGYGRAEAMLYAKYPQRFNGLGQIKWQGTIPGLARTLPGGGVQRVRWTAARIGLQTVYEPMLSLLNFLPQTLEWNLGGIAILLASIACGFSTIPALAMLAMGPLWALHYAWRAPLEKCHDGFISRLFVAGLSYSGPLARAMTRYKLRLRAAMSAGSFAEAQPRQRPQLDLLRRSLRLNYWNEAYITRDALLEKLQKLLTRAGYPAIADPGWNDFDLEVRPGPLTKVQLKTAEEEHGGMRLKTLIMIRVRMSTLSKLAMLAGVLATAAAALLAMDKTAVVAGLLTIAAGAISISEAAESLKRAYRAVEQGAEELELIPLGAKTRAGARRESAAVAARRGTRPLANPELLENPPLVD
jgi:glycosyltransferase involved in cell wall biosynthesis